MRVIDLLNKIANGEEVPEKIQYNGFYFNWTGLNYYCSYEDTFLDELICLEDLNYPVEIIEEPKKKEGFVTNGHRFVPNENGVSIFPIEEDKEMEKSIKPFKEYWEDVNIVGCDLEEAQEVYLDRLSKIVIELVIAVNELKKGK